LLATVVWVFWVFSALADAASLVWLVAGFFFLGLGGWIFGRWDTFARPASVRWIARIIALVFVLAGVGLPLQRLDQATAKNAPVDEGWETFSPDLLAEKRAAGHPVFIDFTAKWCLTCQANKLTVLKTAEVQEAFRSKNAVLMVADWTDKNEMIAAELARHGRQSVPLYLLYPADPAAEPVMLPELLTRKIVLDALQNLN